MSNEHLGSSLAMEMLKMFDCFKINDMLTTKMSYITPTIYNAILIVCLIITDRNEYVKCTHHLCSLL